MNGPADVRDVAQFLESFSFAPPKPLTSRRKWLREQAAVVVYFDSDALADGAPDDDLLDFLGEDCQSVTGTDEREHWALLDGRRREVAAELGLAKLRAAISRKRLPAPSHPVQQAMDRWCGTLRDSPSGPGLDFLDRNDLRALQQVVLWFGAVEPRLPDLTAIERRLAVLELDQPLHELVDEHFRGRADILRLLDSYAAGGTRPPLVLWGPGGIGKSTVIAAFLLRQGSRFPFAYLNFDRAVLDPQKPGTALVEATRQLELRYPQQAALASNVKSKLLDEDYLGQHESSPWVGHIGSGSPSKRTEPTDSALEAFATLAGELTGAMRPLLLVLDTFEEIQRRGRHTVQALLDYLLPLRSRVPGLQLIIAGRSPLDSTTVVNAEIGDFDPESARGYVEARVPGLSDSETNRVLRRVGRNPLSLRLAAELLTRPGVDRATALLSLDRGHVQGILYQRILDHIRDEDVRLIAHPGLVLRRITPAVISEVLAKPCGLTMTGSRGAAQLFNALEAEATLVERRREDPDALWHRADVRQLILPTLQLDDPERASAIHRRAVRFYQKQVGAVARAEELYHRMMLGQTVRTLKRYWSDAAAPWLRGSFDELPPPAQVFLASCIGGDLADRLDEEIRTTADIGTRATHIRNRVMRMLAAGAVGEAYDLITEARAPGGEPLVPDLEIEVREQAGDINGALEVARRHLDRLTEAGAEREYVTTALAVARLLERTGALGKATTVLEDLRGLLSQVGDETGLLQVNVTLLRLARTSGQDRAGLVAETTAIAEQAGTYALAQEPALLRALTAEVGDASDTLLAAGVRHIGLDLTEERNVPARLADALVAYDAEVPPEMGILLAIMGTIMKHVATGEWDQGNLPAQLAAAGSRSVSRSIAQSIDKFGPTEDFRNTLVEFYREQDASAREIRTGDDRG